MKQEKIWDHFQNEDASNKAFPEARQRFMVAYLDRGMTALNVGVGSGALERLALEKGVDIHSLDPSERTIERLRTNGQGEKAQAGYAEAMPFEDSRFDVVVMSEVLEHLDDEVLRAALQEVMRVLKPTGFLLASTPYDEDLAAGEVVCPDCGKVFHRIGHVQSFDKPAMRELLEDAGFIVERLYTTTFVDWRRKGLVNRVKSLMRVTLARLGEKLADPRLIVVARKTPSHG